MTGPDAPSAPTNVQATVNGTDITVTWVDGVSAETHTVTLSAAGESDRTQTGIAAGTQTATFTGLTAATTYAAQVTAVNSAGSAASGAVLASIPAAPVTYVTIESDILTDMTFTADKKWLLRGPIFVGRDVGADGTDPDGISVTLTIEPGTTVLGDVDPLASARGSYLIISRGSRIVADANANRPAAEQSDRPNPDDVIVFTSSAPRGQRARGDWGGLVIDGRAPINSGAEASGEGDSGLYGGNDPDDDSGIIRGVRIEFAGDRVTATDELNGLAPQGVGAGTTIDYVQIHYNRDDGTEPFGGTASMTHVVVTGIEDDSFDGTDGYQGFMQFLIGQQRADAADNGFEISNNGDDENASPHSTAVIANATMVGSNVDLGSGEIFALGGEGDIGLNMREGSNYRVFNSILTGYGKSGFCVEGAQAQTNADNWLNGTSTNPDETLRVESVVLWSNVDPADNDANFTACSGYTLAQNKAFFENAAFNNIIADPNLPAEAFDVGTQSSPPNFIPTAAPTGYAGTFDVASLNNTAGLQMPLDGRVLVTTSYTGALEPGTTLTDAWYYGWTVWSTDGSDSRPNQNDQ